MHGRHCCDRTIDSINTLYPQMSTRTVFSSNSVKSIAWDVVLPTDTYVMSVVASDTVLCSTFLLLALASPSCAVLVYHTHSLYRLMKFLSLALSVYAFRLCQSHSLNRFAVLVCHIHSLYRFVLLFFVTHLLLELVSTFCPLLLCHLKLHHLNLRQILLYHFNLHHRRALHFSTLIIAAFRVLFCYWQSHGTTIAGG